MALKSSNKTLPPRSQDFSIENRNFLSPIGFKFVIQKMRGVEFFCQSAAIPNITMTPAIQSTRVNKIPQPGDEIEYEDLYIKFLVDENMKNWYQVHDWMREIGTPYSAEEFGFDRGSLKSVQPVRRRVSTDGNIPLLNQWKCDCSLFILSNNFRPVAEFIFHSAFPISLGTLEFDASDPNPQNFVAQLTLAYSHYDYNIFSASTATDESMKSTLHTSYKGITID